MVSPWLRSLTCLLGLHEDMRPAIVVDADKRERFCVTCLNCGRSTAGWETKPAQPPAKVIQLNLWRMAKQVRKTRAA